MIGYVYIISHNTLNIKYVGSTSKDPFDRFKNHLNGFNSWLKSGKRHVSIYDYFKKYGVENFTFKVIGQYKVCDNKHIKAYEQIWINKTKCINRNNCLNGCHKGFFKSMNDKTYRVKSDIKERTRKRKQENVDNKKFYCGRCNYSAPDKSKLNRHLKSKMHKNKTKKLVSKDYYCYDCDVQLSYSGYRRHMNTSTHISNVLPFCRKIKKTKEQKKETRRKNRANENKRIREQYKKNLENGKYKCNKCNKSFGAKTNLTRHLKRKTPCVKSI